MNGPPVKPGPFLTPWPGDFSVPQTPRGGRRGRGGVRMLAPGGGSPGGVELPDTAVPMMPLDRFVRVNGSLQFPVGTTSAKILDESPTFRAALLIRNSSGELSPASTAIVRINFGAPATLSSALKLEVDEAFFLDYTVFQDELFAIADAAGQISVMVANIVLPG